MNAVEVTYKQLKTDSFRDFLFQLEISCKYNLRNSEYNDAVINKIQMILDRITPISLEYFSALEVAHTVLQKALKYVFHLYDCILINELNKYNCSVMNAEKETASVKEESDLLFDLMRKDLVLLLCIRSQYYYILAWNDSDTQHITGMFHLETYKHLFGGIKKAIAESNIKEIVQESNRLQLIEIFRRRSEALKNISAMLLLYLYGNYQSFQDIDTCAKALVWIINNGYQWFTVPIEPQQDYLIPFVFMIVPDVGFGFPQTCRICDLYEEIECYKDSMKKLYPNASSDLIDIIERANNMEKKFWDWKLLDT